MSTARGTAEALATAIGIELDWQIKDVTLKGGEIHNRMTVGEAITTLAGKAGGLLKKTKGGFRVSYPTGS